MTLIKCICTGILFVVLNIWLQWLWALLIAIVIIWGGFLIIDGDILD